MSALTHSPEGAGPQLGRTLILALAAAVLLLPSAARAQGNGNGPDHGRGRPVVAFDEAHTPLQQAIEASHGKMKDREREAKPQCRNALADNDAAKIEKFCDFPGLRMRKLDGAECTDCGDLKGPGGQVVGKKTATETILDYARPGQKGKAAWEPVRLKKGAQGGHDGANGGRRDAGSGRGQHVRSAGLLAGADSNDDKDCIDLRTGEHAGGPLVSDGSEDSCFDAEGNLKPLREALVDEDAPGTVDGDLDGSVDEDPPGDADRDGDPNDDGDCVDTQGAFFHGDDCLDAAGRTLPDRLALVDEDGPDDDDGDGSFDEDPPADPAAACRAFGESRGLAGLAELNSSGECDFTRAVIVGINRAAAAKGQPKFFKADDDGNPDPDAEGAFDYGQESRRTKLTETFAIVCPGDGELVAGECLQPPRSSRLAAHGLAAAVPPAKSAAGTAAVAEKVMMGFTFAPPVIEWGYEISEEVCVLGICVEVFYARIGYEFDVAVGLRLPAEVRVAGVPAPSALASSEVTLETALQPLDFTVNDYKEFCEKHHLDDEWYIADCDRFSFPEFLDSLNPFTPADEKDGAELVAREKIFAGVEVRIVEIPVIQWGVNSEIDLPAMCTMLRLREEGIDLLQFGQEVAATGDVLAAIKSSLSNCASFETPFGLSPDPDPVTGSRPLRAFPFSGGVSIGADCAQALAEGKTIVIGGRVLPICTGLVLGVHGASLGIGLGLDLSVGSRRIAADWSVREDAESRAAEQELVFEHAADEDVDAVPLGPFHADNYDPAEFADHARVTLSGFTYYLNALQMELKANLEFGGILDPIPDLASFTLYRFLFDTGKHGIPIGQHPGTEDVEIPIFVENYALKLDARPRPDDPARVDADTLAIRPGQFGDFRVEVDNRGSVSGDFDRFVRELSNRPGQSGELTFTINPNTDLDCTGTAGGHFRGNPYDGAADDCYGPLGEVRADRIELIDEDGFGPEGGTVAERDADGDGLADEDPPDAWETSPEAAAFAQQAILAVPPYTRSGEPPTSPLQTLTLGVKPFRHPLTTPGRYPLRIAGDSRQARELELPDKDASRVPGQARLGASDVVFVEVTSFFDPLLAVRPERPAAKPGVPQAYMVEGSNGGNAADTLALGLEFVDFNQAGCTLTTLGSLPAGTVPGCPYRAVPTRIPAAQWTTAAGLPPAFGPLEPLGAGQGRFTVQVPRDWAGMQDTTYEMVATVTSTADADSPPARRSVVVRQTVVATQESMTRYIGLEIAELSPHNETPNARGIATAGLLPISVHPVRQTNDRALERNLAGDLAGASRAHAANGKIAQGFLKALAAAARKLPAELAADWKARGEAIVRDLAVAEASRIASAQ